MCKKGYAWLWLKILVKLYDLEDLTTIVVCFVNVYSYTSQVYVRDLTF